MQNYGEPEIIPINFSMALAENPAAQHFFACLSPEDKAGFINVVASAPDEETMTQQLARPSTFCKMKTGTTTAYNPSSGRVCACPVLFQPPLYNPHLFVL